MESRFRDSPGGYCGNPDSGPKLFSQEGVLGMRLREYSPIFLSLHPLLALPQIHGVRSTMQQKMFLDLIYRMR
jgi:hypothetical protein